MALARALIRQPALLLCDEPTGNLDRASSEIVADLLIASACRPARRCSSSSRTASRSPGDSAGASNSTIARSSRAHDHRPAGPARASSSTAARTSPSRLAWRAPSPCWPARCSSADRFAPVSRPSRRPAGPDGFRRSPPSGRSATRSRIAWRRAPTRRRCSSLTGTPCTKPRAGGPARPASTASIAASSPFITRTRTAPSGSEVLLSAGPGRGVARRGRRHDPRPHEHGPPTFRSTRSRAAKRMRPERCGCDIEGALGRDSMGEFSLAPTQGPVRASSCRSPRCSANSNSPVDANTLLVAASPRLATPAEVRRALSSALTADDLGLRFVVGGGEFDDRRRIARRPHARRHRVRDRNRGQPANRSK